MIVRPLSDRGVERQPATSTVTGRNVPLHGSVVPPEAVMYGLSAGEPTERLVVPRSASAV